MESFRIEGGVPLSGRVRVSGNKNEALPALACALLSPDPITLDNVPDIIDVRVMLDVMRHLGTEVTYENPNRIRLHTPKLKTTVIPPELGRRVRASILFAGPLVGRAGSVDLPPPGGDVIGRRRLDTHFDGLEQLGARFQPGDTYRLNSSRLRGADIFMDEASVTATENLLMAAASAKGVTTLRNAAGEPHVQGIARMLEKMGAKIDGIGSNCLTIEGADKLGGCEHVIGPDYLEIGSFVGLAAVTGGEVIIEDIVPDDLRMVRMVFDRLGVKTKIRGNDLHVPGRQKLEIRPDMSGHVPKIDDAPWPQFPTDLMSIAITVATQSRGTVLFFEKMFEGRMFFVDSLIGMGAQIILCDPHRAVVVGPSQLYASRLESPDVRAGMSLLIAALCARGTSVIHNIRQIDRGYERIEQKLKALGARIERVNG
ncbi:MAG TPA: UDP-N-acetylglucosamine 1-carboxyvinyltransferase [Myxococcales bacterium]|mgnify:CR=1 FL=1|nr:UDP-N-acetylglucosamine 1-carboxyvinyltransferase [Myxococcales bacterium]HAN32104.1 UDP-N-acetylglucosamine 1-carboxyvinyltransferase [Myxococcales bacterium]